LSEQFTVYVFHPPIVILLARAMVELHWPPLVKALKLTGLAASASFAATALFLRRIPLKLSQCPQRPRQLQPI